jgi:hypothetical protein
MKRAIKQTAVAALLFAFIICGPASSFSQRKNGSGPSAAPTFDSSQATAFVGVNVIPLDRERVLTIRNGFPDRKIDVAVQVNTSVGPRLGKTARACRS